MTGFIQEKKWDWCGNLRESIADVSP